MAKDYQIIYWEDTLMHVDIGGRQLCLETAGHGTPTVVLEAGAGSTKQTWDPVWSAIAAVTTVCRYDRAGVGDSDPATSPRSALNVVADLHLLLHAAGVPGPYLLVGHSFGGLMVRLFAHQHPSEVAGIVLIDSSQPEQRSRSLAALPPQSDDEPPALSALRQRYSAPDDVLAEGVSFSQSLAEVAAVKALGPVPLVALSRTYPPSAEQLKQLRPGLPTALADELEQVWQDLQREASRLSPLGAHQMAARSGHYVHRDEPELVVEAIREVMKALESS